jgi:hypothetical protein
VFGFLSAHSSSSSSSSGSCNTSRSSASYDIFQHNPCLRDLHVTLLAVIMRLVLQDSPPLYAVYIQTAGATHTYTSNCLLCCTTICR